MRTRAKIVEQTFAREWKQYESFLVYLLFESRTKSNLRATFPFVDSWCIWNFMSALKLGELQEVIVFFSSYVLLLFLAHSVPTGSHFFYYNRCFDARGEWKIRMESVAIAHTCNRTELHINHVCRKAWYVRLVKRTWCYWNCSKYV